ncbi:MAG: ATP/GTP-binding protein [Nitrosopumilaceae archaeon]|nr:ATP/GTP-binding protein [Nitrosopumilaceae archaeon]
MKSVFISGTAGSGKSLLTSKLHEYYTRNGAFAAVLNLDAGVESLPYTCDIDVRDHIDLVSIMRQYDLGPNGSLIMASDLIASKIDDIRTQVDDVNPDYLIVDTPGQVELFAYRSSGGYVVDNISAGEKTSIFLFDGALITTPVNFVSIALLSTSIRLRLGLPAINAVTKTDLIGPKIKDILRWSSSLSSLEDAVAAESDGETYTLTSNILRGLNIGGFAQGLVPVSNVTGDGLVTLEGALSRILNRGEEVED